MKKKLVIGILAALGALIIVLQAVTGNPSYEYRSRPLPANFEEYYQERLVQSKNLKARPGNEERLIRQAPGKTPIALLYIHGFGASRAEGEYIVEKLSNAFKANTYFLRLPGHGTNMEDHRQATYRDHLDESITALLMMEKLGDKVIVVGTSMGGCITTYLAAKYPEKIAGIILCAPFYNFSNPVNRIMYFYPAYAIISTAMKVRVTPSSLPPEKDVSVNFWYRRQYVSAIRQVIDMSNLFANRDTFRKVALPVLMLYHYKNEREQDPTASVADMKRAFSVFGTATKPNPLNREVAVARGRHVLMSRYEDADWNLVEKESADFIRAVVK